MLNSPQPSAEQQARAEQIVAKLMNRNVDAVLIIAQALDTREREARRLREALEAVMHAFHPKFYQGCDLQPCDLVRTALTPPAPEGT